MSKISPRESVLFNGFPEIKNPYGDIDRTLAQSIDDFEFGLVSVIMPCYNSEKYLKEAIESVLNQTYPKVELIVIDDGSSDASRDVIKSYGDKIRAIYQENSGACIARNAGLSVAKGEYIQFLDADDLLDDQAIERCVAAIDPDTDIVFGNYDQISESGERVGEVTFCDEGSWGQAKIFCYLLEKPARILISNLLHKRRHIYEAGGFDRSLPRYQEANLHLRLAAMGVRFKYLNSSIGSVRFHQSPTRISVGNWWRDPEFILKITANYYYEVRKLNAGLVDDFFRGVLAKMIRDQAVIITAFVSIEWGVKYLKDADKIATDHDCCYKGIVSKLGLLIKAYWLKFKICGGKLKRRLQYR